MGIRFVILGTNSTIMKIRSLLYPATLAFGMFVATGVIAQDSTGKKLEKAGQKATKAVEKTANKVGNKTAEIASKGKSAVVDKVYEGKKGPDGEKIYIDGESKYYYVDKKGHKKYVPENKLRDN